MNYTAFSNEIALSTTLEDAFPVNQLFVEMRPFRFA